MAAPESDKDSLKPNLGLSQHGLSECRGEPVDCRRSRARHHGHLSRCPSGHLPQDWCRRRESEIRGQELKDCDIVTS